MLTVLELCDGEYRAGVFLQHGRQGVTSLLIGDIRVSAGVSYLQFWSLLFYLFIYLSLFLTLSHVILISSLAVIASLSFAFEVAVPCIRILTVWQRDGKRREVNRRQKEGKESWVTSRRSLTSGAASVIPGGNGVSLLGLAWSQTP